MRLSAKNNLRKEKNRNFAALFIQTDMGFLRILLIAVLIFYAFNMIIKMIFRHKMKKLQQQMEQFSQGEAQSPTEETQKAHVDPNIGEYTDFEEIE